ncbi:Asp23/Gls24 family envelope stress response protein [Cryptosporangium japonicum]|uniref:Asp23/Gls24 family envelope stress response protein n=1 Tax=Cryptosporangium japonicum TaxID=80872 RepID=A0ABP3DEZ7_9ACTN
MTETTTTTKQNVASTPRSAGSSELVVRGSRLAGDLGSTSIADTVVSKIAGIAARDVAGVHTLGSGAARTITALRERIPGSRTNHSQGVSVEVGETQAAVDIDLIAEYGVAITELAAGVRRNVITSVERMTGLEVVEVNIAVADIYLPDEDTAVESDRAPRVL